MKKGKFKLPEKYLPLVKNKYTLTLLGFIVWLSFFDRNDFITTHSYQIKLESLKNQEKFYDDGIKKYSGELKNLLSNPRDLEKYGREKYFMKKDNEDIFAIVGEPEKKD